MKWYYYLHTNGDLIGKNPIVADGEYFDSPFVKKVWFIETENRGDAWKLVLEMLALGGRISRAKELVENWKLTFDDSINLLQMETPTDLMKKGMDIFIPHFLGMTVDEYWEKAKISWK